MSIVAWILQQFHNLSSSAKKFENRLRFDKVTESLKVGTFLRHSVVSNLDALCYCFVTVCLLFILSLHPTWLHRNKYLIFVIISLSLHVYSMCAGCTVTVRLCVEPGE